MLGSSGAQPVSVRRLDDVLDECLAGIPDPRIFLKIDTQGYDLAVLGGASGCLHRILGLQTELSQKRIYEGAPHMVEALQFYKERGFASVGFFPIAKAADGLSVIEWDCVLNRSPEGG
jgi:hypothetical protein